MFTNLNNPHTCINLEARMTPEMQYRSWALHIKLILIFLTKVKATLLKGNVTQTWFPFICVLQTLPETLDYLYLTFIYQIKLFPTLVFKLIKNIIYTGYIKMEHSVINQAPDSGVQSHFQVQP